MSTVARKNGLARPGLLEVSTAELEAIEGGLDPVTAVMLGIVIGAALGVGFSILGQILQGKV